MHILLPAILIIAGSVIVTYLGINYPRESRSALWAHAGFVLGGGLIGAGIVFFLTY